MGLENSNWVFILFNLLGTHKAGIIVIPPYYKIPNIKVVTPCILIKHKQQ